MAEASPALIKKKSVSRIPRLQRSASFHGQAKRFSLSQHVAEEEDLTEAQDDLGSLSSFCSIGSCAVSSSAYRRAVESACDFRKGNPSAKYALHCSTSSTSNGVLGEYLTPTQRANKTIRQLKSLLKESEANSNYKDFEIQRLTRELVGLRLEHAQCDKKTSTEEKDADNTINLTTPSLADSGHFDDINYHTNQSVVKDSRLEKDSDLLVVGGWAAERNKTSLAHADKMEELIRQHTDEMQNVRARFTDRLELALTQLGDSNTRYANLLTNHDLIREEIKQAEVEQLRLRQHIAELEKKVTQLHIQMEERETQEYESREKELNQIESLSQELASKNKQISELESELENLSTAIHASTSTNTDCEDLSQEQHFQAVVSVLEKQEEKISYSETEKYPITKAKEDMENHPSADPSVILKFLRSAIFYLLTDSENGTEHLRAIQSILEFSPAERSAVERLGKFGYL